MEWVGWKTPVPPFSLENPIFDFPKMRWNWREMNFVNEN